MKKTLGAVALAGASALVLAGCAGGAPAEPETGDITVWLVGADTPQTARDYLKQTFESENEGWTLTIEEKTWADVSDTYTAALSSNDSPDVVEVGNTQALGFADAGLFLDISDIQDQLGGSDLLPGLVEAGTYEGSLYAAPYYAGGRIVFYSPMMVDEVPATLDEYVAEGVAMTTDTVSGIYAPGKDWYNALPYIWAFGGEIAVQDGDTWDAQFSSPESLEGLNLLQTVYQDATVAPADGNELMANIAFCNGEAGFISSPAWAAGNLTGAWPWADEDAGQNSEGCPDTYAADLGAFALPGLEAGETAPIFAGGSNVAVATKSAAPTKAKAALEIMLSEDYQKLLAEQGLTPGIISAASALPDTPIAQAQAAALANSKGTPASPNWAEVEAAQIIPDALVRIAQGEDVEAVATALDEQIEAILNQ
ncbi:MAG: sugar transporter [Actinobacteria bacterium]|jgi:N,N'-diacetylchitobiose transport system substrate-binding protein|uniref:extracellular solute-binding protein n=1 Tax=unclassified Microbacterium TaxID=2609290 RepID=UPI000C668A1B|nr:MULTISPECIES: extracellular solute-binding protein [unclassified Microbacterium]MEC8763261.1 extracellular solute-binding protein [Actinomycetota bacterium]MBU19366.1 sugar transporter [Microbacterium sp.]RUA27827.1 MAG: sugar transporter [Actinomycetota bacterium]HAJ18388.1 sugar transporter [Microbacterium sp.]HAM13503.1 sugar transporter [Microbacterium sp.]|tara:strand:+ start:3946 stop:5217 length:1272 start_codon:yes stop_codon:yes gene_type:complete